MEKFLYISCVILFLSVGLMPASSDNYILKSLSVTFRHGDRLPEPYPAGFYPNDPYINYTFYPIENADLTNDGKKREYELGASLRKRYNLFLGKYYQSSDVSVMSSDFGRTRTSLLLVLAGLYPPTGNQVWKNDLDWQPIPVNVNPLFASTVRPTNCPKYLIERERVMNSEEYKKDVSRFQDLMKKLTVLMGREVNNTNIIFNLYHTLTSEKSMNLTLPEWTELYFPDGLVLNATLFEYDTQSYNKLLMKLNGGIQIRQILSNFEAAKKSITENKTKLHLYSLHESNMVAILKVLNLWKSFVPEYSSAIVFEHYEKKSKDFIKIIYYKGIPSEFDELTIPGCSEFCSLEDFFSNTRDVLPDDALEACIGSPADSLLIPKSEDPVKWIYKQLREWFSM